jgi:predicted nuclease with TOPRIM domain
MDAEFVGFLDKKFNEVNQKLDRLTAGWVILDEKVDKLDERVGRLEEAVEHLTRSIDRMLKMWEDLNVEQKSIIADLNRIKAVLKEKLGVTL